MADETLKSLKKENEEMKQELDYIDRNRKVNDFLGSTIFAVLMALLFGIIMVFAHFGAYSVIKELALSELSAALLLAFIKCANLFGYIYIAWHWFIVFIMNFHEELIQIGKDIKIYVQAGRKALAEMNKPQKPEKTEQKKPSKPRKKPAHGKDGRFAKKPKPSVTPPPA